MKALFFGLLIGVLLPFLAGWLFVVNGGMPVRTKDSALPLEEYLAHQALHAAMKSAGNATAPFVADEIGLLAGAKVYRENCSVCHGLPGSLPTGIAKGMFPPPPQLYQADEGVEDDPPGRVFWKIKNGIRLTGMPGFSDSLSETEMWQVTLLLGKGGKVSDSVTQALKGPRL
jgi:thiosulfate dehydrogenase